MTRWLCGLVGFIWFAGACQLMTLDPVRQKIVDLTHPLDANTVFWPTETGFVLEREFFGKTEGGYFYASNKFSSPEHGGTHMDAPLHFSQNGKSVDQVPLEQLIGPAVLIDVAAACAADPDYQIRTEDFLAWEKRNGRIPDHSIVLLRTGFGKFWPERKSYLGTDERGPQAVAKLRFPGLHPEAAHWLIAERGLKAVGIDTASIDYGRSKGFETHRRLFEKNVPALENLANLDRLPERDFDVIALPMKIAEGSGAPLRAIALMPAQ